MGDPLEAAALVTARLVEYSQTLDEWSKKVSKTMIDRAGAADMAVWKKVGKNLSHQTRELLKGAIGTQYATLQAEQVTLIKSIPLEAAKKVHEWTQDGLAKGQRFQAISDRIKTELGAATKARAVCIARTETARARTNFTRARCEAVGSRYYRWHTVGDADVRPMHAALDGTIQRWDDPPACDIGKGGVKIHASPGCVFNCRCFAEPLFEADLEKLGLKK